MSSDPVIQVENVGKKYLIGHQSYAPERQRYARFSDVLLNAAQTPVRWWRNRHAGPRHSLEDFWALRDVSFEIKRGEVVGVIGRNGAGKSTLLKILSRITEPTTGRIVLDGRVASLLEVGTGFHPELTGRENVFLNGAILGMTRAEIRSKFDEIVAFAEVEQFLDTPVKHYSSGMYVRLAFAVAAHLDPDILVVDEVLAVGDMQFQKKCLGKMSEISSQKGRTVLFVSHNIGTINTLCAKSMFLQKGHLLRFGETAGVVAEYLRQAEGNAVHHVSFPADAGKRACFLEAQVYCSDAAKSGGIFSVRDELSLKIRFRLATDARAMNLAMCLKRNGTPLLLSFDTDLDSGLADHRSKGDWEATLKLPGFLKAGSYSINLSMGFTGIGLLDRRDDALHFDLEEIDVDFSAKGYASSRIGEIACPIKWTMQPVPTTPAAFSP